MPTYLVRQTADQKHPLDFVGVFVAEDIGDLREYVDECTDIDACEFTILPNGGVYLPKPSLTIPYDVGESEEGDHFKGATITDSWFGYFIGAKDEAKWEPLEGGEDDF